MANWSAENATRAYLRALKMGKTGKEPDVAEFISALAAGNNAQLMVVACADTAGSTALSLVAAASQTGGRVVCILGAAESVAESRKALGRYADSVDFLVGDAETSLRNDDRCRGADFVLIDFRIKDHKRVFKAAEDKAAARGGRGLVVGYNALRKGSWLSENKTEFLPIGDGLVIVTVGSRGGRRKSRWVVKVDKWTGEEHVFRITSPFLQIGA